MTAAQLEVLEAVVDGSARSVPDVADWLGLTLGAASMQLNRLRDQGYIEVAHTYTGAGPGAGRRTFIATPEGILATTAPTVSDPERSRARCLANALTATRARAVELEQQLVALCRPTRERRTA